MANFTNLCNVALAQLTSLRKPPILKSLLIFDSKSKSTTKIVKLGNRSLCNVKSKLAFSTFSSRDPKTRGVLVKSVKDSRWRNLKNPFSNVEICFSWNSVAINVSVRKVGHQRFFQIHNYSYTECTARWPSELCCLWY